MGVSAEVSCSRICIFSTTTKMEWTQNYRASLICEEFILDSAHLTEYTNYDSDKWNNREFVQCSETLEVNKQGAGSSEIREVARVRVDKLNWWKKNLCRSAKYWQEAASHNEVPAQRRRATTELEGMTSPRDIVSLPAAGRLIYVSYWQSSILNWVVIDRSAIEISWSVLRIG